MSSTAAAAAEWGLGLQSAHLSVEVLGSSWQQQQQQQQQRRRAEEKEEARGNLFVQGEAVHCRLRLQPSFEGVTDRDSAAEEFQGLWETHARHVGIDLQLFAITEEVVDAEEEEEEEGRGGGREELAVGKTHVQQLSAGVGGGVPVAAAASSAAAAAAAAGGGGRGGEGGGGRRGTSSSVKRVMLLRRSTSTGPRSPGMLDEIAADGAAKEDGADVGTEEYDEEDGIDENVATFGAPCYTLEEDGAVVINYTTILQVNRRFLNTLLRLEVCMTVRPFAGSGTENYSAFSASMAANLSRQSVSDLETVGAPPPPPPAPAPSQSARPSAATASPPMGLGVPAHQQQQTASSRRHNAGEAPNVHMLRRIFELARAAPTHIPPKRAACSLMIIEPVRMTSTAVQTDLWSSLVTLKIENTHPHATVEVADVILHLDNGCKQPHPGLPPRPSGAHAPQAQQQTQQLARRHSTDMLQREQWETIMTEMASNSGASSSNDLVGMTQESAVAMNGIDDGISDNPFLIDATHSAYAGQPQLQPQPTQQQHQQPQQLAAADMYNFMRQPLAQALKHGSAAIQPLAVEAVQSGRFSWWYQGSFLYNPKNVRLAPGAECVVPILIQSRDVGTSHNSLLKCPPDAFTGALVTPVSILWTCDYRRSSNAHELDEQPSKQEQALVTPKRPSSGEAGTSTPVVTATAATEPGGTEAAVPPLPAPGQPQRTGRLISSVHPLRWAVAEKSYQSVFLTVHVEREVPFRQHFTLHVRARNLCAEPRHLVLVCGAPWQPMVAHQVAEMGVPPLTKEHLQRHCFEHGWAPFDNDLSGGPASSCSAMHFTDDPLDTATGLHLETVHLDGDGGRGEYSGHSSTGASTGSVVVHEPLTDLGTLRSLEEAYVALHIAVLRQGVLHMRHLYLLDPDTHSWFHMNNYELLLHSSAADS